MSEFKKKHIEELLRFSTAMTGSQDDSGDLVSSAMEKILTKYPNVKESSEFLKLSYTIIRREYIDIKRKKKKTVSLGNIGNNQDDDTLNNNATNFIEYKARDLDENVRVRTMDPEESMMEREFTISKESKYKIAQNCLSDLDNETQKSVLTLFSEGLKYDEIASRLDIPVGTVKSSLLRARTKVADCIRKRLKNEK